MSDPGVATRIVEHVRIPLRDGTRLSGRIWFPADRAATPLPAVLEYLPYRKDDVTAENDATRHAYVAAHGYACVRVDLRGSGSSEGRPLDEYHPQEQEDALDVVAWIAAQSWCTGAVGMTGISWSGFNSLQLAGRRPPALRAIITACSTDDRYDNDVHYMGGSPLGYYLLPWSTAMLAFASRPPDPALVGEQWRSLWQERLEHAPHLIETWLQHQRRDEYWVPGSVGDRPQSITCPVLAVGGWADAYTDSILRLLERLEAPCWGLIGPWGHSWPHVGAPGPAVGFLQECVRWWDHWLKGEGEGFADVARLRAWMPEPAQRADDDPQRGRWLAIDGWPAPEVDSLRLALRADATIGAGAGRAGTRQGRSPQTLGIDAGAWCGYGNAGDAPADQRRDDADALSWDGEPLEGTVEIIGPLHVRLRVAADRPRAFVAVRVCDVAPDGHSTLVARGVLNLCHRSGHDRPELLEPGRFYDVVVALKAVAHAFAAGHRIRVAVSSTLWPWIWPSPEPVTLTVAGEGSMLELPRWTRDRAEDPLVEFASPVSAPPPPVEVLRPRAPVLRVTDDRVGGVTRYEMARDFVGAKRLPSGLVYEDSDPVTLTIAGDDPLSARVAAARTVRLARDDWSVRLEVRSVMTGDRDTFHATTTLDAFEGETHVFTANHDCTVPRDHC